MSNVVTLLEATILLMVTCGEEGLNAKSKSALTYAWTPCALVHWVLISCTGTLLLHSCRLPTSLQQHTHIFFVAHTPPKYCTLLVPLLCSLHSSELKTSLCHVEYPSGNAASEGGVCFFIVIFYYAPSCVAKRAQI